MRPARIQARRHGCTPQDSYKEVPASSGSIAVNGIDLDTLGRHADVAKGPCISLFGNGANSGVAANLRSDPERFRQLAD